MINRIVASLILLLFWTAIPSGVQAVEPRYPDSAGYKKCMANCNTPGTTENKMKLYMNSCESVCADAGAEEFADLSITVINAANKKQIQAFYEVTGPDGYSEKGSMGENDFRNLKAGAYTVKVEMIYFLPQTVNVYIDPAKSRNHEVKVSLKPDPDGPLGKSASASFPEKDCPEKFCHGNVMHYDGHFDPKSGECVSRPWTCKLGCDPATGECIPSVLQLQSVSFDPTEAGLILNGRNKVVLSGRAVYDNPNNESLQGLEIAMESVVPTADGDKKPRLLGVRSFMARVKKDGRFTLDVISEYPVNPKINVKGLELLVRAKEFPEANTKVKLVSPAPMITKAAMRNMREKKNQKGMWQESYGVFGVEADDPDNIIVSYTIRAKQGTIRIDEVDWDGLREKTVLTAGRETWKNLEFAWKSPPMTEHLKLDLLRDLRNEWESAAKDMAASTLKKVGEKAVGISLTEAQADLIDPDAAHGLMSAAHNRDLQGGGLQLLKYGLPLHHNKFVNAAGDVISATEDLHGTYKDVENHTGDQAARMGEAFESGHEFYKEEMAARLFSIFLDGVKLYDGVFSFAASATGRSDDSLANSMKNAVQDATIGSVQRGAEYIANTYKAAGARIKTLPFFIEVIATDEDGFTGSGKIIVEVSGYESLIQ